MEGTIGSFKEQVEKVKETTTADGRQRKKGR